MARSAATGVQGATPAGRTEVSDQQRPARAQHPAHFAERGWARRLGDVVYGQQAGEVATAASDIQDLVPGLGAGEGGDAGIHPAPAADEGNMGDGLVPADVLERRAVPARAAMLDPPQHHALLT